MHRLHAGRPSSHFTFRILGTAVSQIPFPQGAGSSRNSLARATSGFNPVGTGLFVLASCTHDASCFLSFIDRRHRWAVRAACNEKEVGSAADCVYWRLICLLAELSRALAGRKQAPHAATFGRGPPPASVPLFWCPFASVVRSQCLHRHWPIPSSRDPPSAARWCPPDVPYPHGDFPKKHAMRSFTA